MVMNDKSQSHYNYNSESNSGRINNVNMYNNVFVCNQNVKSNSEFTSQSGYRTDEVLLEDYNSYNLVEGSLLKAALRMSANSKGDGVVNCNTNNTNNTTNQNVYVNHQISPMGPRGCLLISSMTFSHINAVLTVLSSIIELISRTVSL